MSVNDVPLAMLQVPREYKGMRISAAGLQLGVVTGLVSVDQHVVQIDEDTVKSIQNVLNDALERLRAVGEAHCEPLEEIDAPGSLDRSLHSRGFFQLYLVERFHQIDLTEGVEPFSLWVKWRRFGRGKLSRTVLALRSRKTPHGLRPPEGLGWRWRALDQGTGVFGGTFSTIPNSTNSSHAFFPFTSFSDPGSRGLVFALHGGSSPVSMTCLIPNLGLTSLKLGLRMLGYF